MGAVRLPLAAGLAAAVVLGAGGFVRAQPAAMENRLKAAVVAKIPQFVEWPDGVLSGRATVDICVGPPDPFGSDLDELEDGETLNGRAVAVRRVERPMEVDGCQVLFLPRGAGRHPLLDQASAQPILTIGDDEDFLDNGGIIQLRLVNGRVRFDVNAEAAQRVGLRISSQLLRLARTVRGASR